MQMLPSMGCKELSVLAWSACERHGAGRLLLLRVQTVLQTAETKFGNKMS